MGLPRRPRRQCLHPGILDALDGELIAPGLPTGLHLWSYRSRYCRAVHARHSASALGAKALLLLRQARCQRINQTSKVNNRLDLIAALGLLGISPDDPFGPDPTTTSNYDPQQPRPLPAWPVLPACGLPHRPASPHAGLAACAPRSRRQHPPRGLIGRRWATPSPCPTAQRRWWIRR